MGTIYLIHFARRLHHAGHYLGWCSEDVAKRIERHRRGDGAKLLRAVQAAGITWHVVRTWAGTRDDERAMKKRSHVPRLCPVCRGEVSAAAAAAGELGAAG